MSTVKPKPVLSQGQQSCQKTCLASFCLLNCVQNPVILRMYLWAVFYLIDLFLICLCQLVQGLPIVKSLYGRGKQIHSHLCELVKTKKNKKKRK